MKKLRNYSKIMRTNFIQNTFGLQLCFYYICSNSHGYSDVTNKRWVKWRIRAQYVMCLVGSVAIVVRMSCHVPYAIIIVVFTLLVLRMLYIFTKSFFDLFKFLLTVVPKNQECINQKNPSGYLEIFQFVDCRKLLRRWSSFSLTH